MTNKRTILVVQRILIFTIFIIVLDFLVGSGLEYLYFKQKDGLYARTTYGLEKTTAQVLIFGSSSANHHYNPTIFEETLNLFTYNEGRDGIDILYHTAILKGLLIRYTPKVIILNLTYKELTFDQGYDRLSSLLPYLRKYPEMKEIVSLRSKFETWKLFSKIYPYNSTFLTMINGLYRVTKVRNQDKGYVPVYGNMNTYNLKEDVIREYPIDSNKIQALADFIDLCKERKILTYLIFSPFFNIQQNDSHTIEIAKRFAKEKGVFYYNFIDDPRFKGQTNLFKDVGHLNHDGATKFSAIISEIILADLKKNQNSDLTIRE